MTSFLYTRYPEKHLLSYKPYKPGDLVQILNNSIIIVRADPAGNVVNSDAFSSKDLFRPAVGDCVLVIEDQSTVWHEYAYDGNQVSRKEPGEVSIRLLVLYKKKIYKIGPIHNDNIKVSLKKVERSKKSQ